MNEKKHLLKNENVFRITNKKPQKYESLTIANTFRPINLELDSESASQAIRREGKGGIQTGKGLTVFRCGLPAYTTHADRKKRLKRSIQIY